mgnify:CR=1 FL=1
MEVVWSDRPTVDELVACVVTSTNTLTAGLVDQSLVGGDMHTNLSMKQVSSCEP